jgi:hypothetical protein
VIIVSTCIEVPCQVPEQLTVSQLLLKHTFDQDQQSFGEMSLLAMEYDRCPHSHGSAIPGVRVPAATIGVHIRGDVGALQQQQQQQWRPRATMVRAAATALLLLAAAVPGKTGQRLEISACCEIAHCAASSLVVLSLLHVLDAPVEELLPLGFQCGPRMWREAVIQI